MAKDIVSPRTTDLDQLLAILQQNYPAPNYVTQKPKWFIPLFYNGVIFVKNGPVMATVILRKNGMLKVRGGLNVQHTPYMIPLIISFVLIRLLAFLLYFGFYMYQKKNIEQFEEQVANTVEHGESLIDQIGRKDDDDRFNSSKLNF